MRPLLKLTATVLASALIGTAQAQTPENPWAISPVTTAIHWDKVLAVSRLNATTQIGNAKKGPLYDKLYKQLHDYDSNYPRWQMWGGGAKDPTLGVAEKAAPKDGKTFWDFSEIDPSLLEFVKAVDGHPYLVNLEMTPEWMYVPDPNIATDPRGPIARVLTPRKLAVTPQVFGEYYARAVGWYTKGGFTDEVGKWHESGYHLKIPYWEVLNERDTGQMTPQEYTVLYDAVVEATRKINPDIKFAGMVLVFPAMHPEFFEYFLNPKNHKPGIPLDMITYHAYVKYSPYDSKDTQIATSFNQTDVFLSAVRFANVMRDAMSPGTLTSIDEMGSIIGVEAPQVHWPADRQADVPFHLKLSAATYAYVYGNMAGMSVDAAGLTGMGIAGTGNVGAYAALSMLKAGTAEPNIRYKVAKLLMNNFGPGSKLVDTVLGVNVVTSPYPVYVQAFLSPEGKHRVLLVNKRDEPGSVILTGAKGAKIQYLDSDGDTMYSERTASADTIDLHGLEIAIVTMP